MFRDKFRVLYLVFCRLKAKGKQFENGFSFVWSNKYCFCDQMQQSMSVHGAIFIFTWNYKQFLKFMAKNIDLASWKRAKSDHVYCRNVVDTRSMSAEYRSSVDRASIRHRSTIGEVPIRYRPSVDETTTISADAQPTLDWRSVHTRPIDTWPTSVAGVGRHYLQ